MYICVRARAYVHAYIRVCVCVCVCVCVRACVRACVCVLTDEQLCVVVFPRYGSYVKNPLCDAVLKRSVLFCFVVVEKVACIMYTVKQSCILKAQLPYSATINVRNIGSSTQARLLAYTAFRALSRNSLLKRPHKDTSLL